MDEITPILSSTSGENEEDVSCQQDLKVYKRRFWVLLTFSLLSAQQSNIWLTFGVIPDKTRAYYGIASWQIDLLAGKRGSCSSCECVPGPWTDAMPPRVTCYIKGGHVNGA